MKIIKITDAQKNVLARRLAQLNDQKKEIFRTTLEAEGIDPWQLPIIPEVSVAKVRTPEVKSPEANLPETRIQECGKEYENVVEGKLQNDYPLSYSQQRLWFIEQLEPGNPMYNIFSALRFGRNLQISAFQKALNDIVKDHQVLRTNFISIKGEGRQRIRDYKPFTLPVIELTEKDFYDVDSKTKVPLNAVIQRIAEKEARKPFDLSSDQRMLRVTVVKCSDFDGDNSKESNACFIVLFTFHHIAFDAWSTVNFMGELNSNYIRYSEICDGKVKSKDSSNNKEVHKIKLQYTDYAKWQREWINSSAYKKQAQYWKQQLESAPRTLSLATEYLRPNTMTYRGDVAGIHLPREMSEALYRLAEKENATFYMLMLAAFNVLLSRYSRQNDICVGTSIANRPHVELEGLLGFFVNTLVMRNQVKNDETFKQFLNSVKHTATSAYNNKDLPFDKLMDLLEIEREQNTTPLFQVLFVLNNALDGLSLNLGDVDASIYPTPLYYSRFDLTLRITQENSVLAEGSILTKDSRLAKGSTQNREGIYCEMEFNTALYSKSMIERMLMHYRCLLEQVVARPDYSVNQLTMLTTSENEQLLNISNFEKNPEIRGCQPYQLLEKDKLGRNVQTIHAQFEYLAENLADKTAVIYEQQTLTYRELNTRANQLAHKLLECGVEPQQHLGVLLERSANFIISILAILKAGATYVPLDTQWPSERLAYIIKDACLLTLLSEKPLVNDLPIEKLRDTSWLLLDDESLNFRSYSEENPIVDYETQSPGCLSAYLIYTSGSTGEPKGTVIEHRHLLNYIDAIVDHLDLAGRSFALISTVAADLGNTSLYGALCFGGSLHVISHDRANDAGELAQYFKQHKIDVLKIVPSHLRGLMVAINDGYDAEGQPLAKSILPHYCLILGGEACSLSLVENVHRLSSGDCRIVNHYGPTETTVGALTYEYKPKVSFGNTLIGGALPIGQPLANTRVYIVDQYDQLCPIGVPGELLISGAGVARGYHGRDKLTQQRFFPNPFIAKIFADNNQDIDIHNICYRTGDKVRRLANGEIEFIGRLDQQVKIRGYRVEPGEIESLLRTLSGVEEAVVNVIKNADNQNQLATYLVLDDSTDRDTIHQYLKNKLPDYMQPQWLLTVTELPRTSNGKIDYRSLPDPQKLLDDSTANSPSREPTNHKEQLLADIWCEVLRLESVDIDSNFFELGGDSILSLQIIARAKKAGLKLTPKQLFEQKTIAGAAAVGKLISNQSEINANSQKENSDAIIENGTCFNLSPIQKWFFEAQHSEPSHWNQSALFKINGSLDYAILQAAVAELLHHHDSLRLRFVKKQGHWQQFYNKEINNNLCQCFDVIGEDNWQQQLESQATKIQQSLDIENGPLLRVAYFRGASVANSNKIDNELEIQSTSDKKTDDYILFAIHHLVVDGVSWRILMSDLQNVYQQYLARKKIDLGSKSSSYQQWITCLDDYANKSASNTQTNKKIDAQMEYWKQTYKVGEFPVQYPNGNNTMGSVQVIKRSLSRELSQALVKSVPAVYRTQINDILVSALSQLLANVCQSEWILLEMEGHGREDIFESLDLSQTFGWFTSRYPVYLRPGTSEGSELIKNIKEQLRQVPDNGLGFSVLRYLKHSKDEAFAEILQQCKKAPISFNYLGQFDLDLSGQGIFLPTSIKPGVERAASSKRSFYIDLNAHISNEQLQVEWHYSRDLHSTEWIEQLADDYQKYLICLIETCLDDSIGAVTPSDFPLAKLTQVELDSIKLPWYNIESIYPLTSMQEGLLFHTLMNPGTGIYFMQYRYEMTGYFDPKAFKKAWQCVVDRHEILRTAFLRHEHSSLQVVYKDVPSPVEFIDWRHLSDAQQRKKLKEWMADQLSTGFDLSKPTQMAITLVRVAEDRYHFIRSFHHILTDAWCFSLLMMDFMSYYEALVKGDNLLLPKPRRFCDYISWLQKQDIDRAQRYWREVLAGFNAPTSLTVDRPQVTTGVRDLVVSLDVEQTEHLQRLVKQLEITLNTFVQGAWGLLLNRYSGNSDIVFGVTVAGRPADLEGAENIVGLFINSLPLRVSANSELSASEYLKNIFSRNLSMREYEFAPLVDIQRWSDVPAGEALFNSLVVYENAPIDPEMYKKLSIFELGEITNRTHTNYPLTVVVFPEKELGLQLTYDASVFDDVTIERLLSQFRRLLLNLAAATDTERSGAMVALSSIELLSPEEQKQQLIDWNQTYTDYPRQECWPTLFARQVEQTPIAIAVACGEKKLSYLELFERSQHIAYCLKKAGVGADDIVAILDQRGIDLLIMIVAVLTAGAAYLPLDPKHPEKRLATVIDLSEPKVILGSDESLPAFSVALGMLENQQSLPELFSLQQLSSQTDSSHVLVQPDCRPNNLAYIIYTSGSTGVPKGAMIEHLGMLNNVYAKIPALSLSDKDVIAQTASQCFDISVWQFLTALICGARVQIYPDDISHNPRKLLAEIEKDHVTILESVPSLVQSFLDVGSPLSHLRWLMPTGEALSSDLAQRWLSHYRHIPLMNVYGPAECADDVAFWPIFHQDNNEHITGELSEPAGFKTPMMPIGRPTDNNRLYVLNDSQQLQSIGVTGELYVAGAGVGRGYLNDSERTGRVFIKNKLLQHRLHQEVEANRSAVNALDNPERLYRTGDLARWRSDGVLEYMGRTDHQVKIRGFRIELGEIEACLESHPLVRFAAVLVKPDPRGDQSLVAYYQINESTSLIQNGKNVNDEDAFERELIRVVKNTLPVYMLPSLFICLSAMPMSNNGKIDRRALPEPEFSSHEKTVTAPRNDTERRLVEFWQQILKIDKVDIHESFFALGGHSLLAVQLHAKVCKYFDIELPLRTLFEHNSVAEVASQLELRLAAHALVSNHSELKAANNDISTADGDNAVVNNCMDSESRIESDDAPMEEFEL